VALEGGVCASANFTLTGAADGDVWRIFFGRFELLKPEGQELNPHPAWVWSRHALYDTHIPECFPYIQMSNKTVGQP
jgi:hypothetical protein